MNTMSLAGLLAALLATGVVVAGRLDSAEAAFQRRVEEYQKLRGAVRTRTPELPEEAEPEQISAFKQSLRRQLIERRAWAQPGHFFAPELIESWRAKIGSLMQGPDGPGVWELMRDGHGIEFEPRVNVPYPAEWPLPTTPPHLLELLPDLPEPLEFRFTGRRLLLVDAEAELILDYSDPLLTEPREVRP